MPQTGGEKCLEELLKINPQVKVIVSTGHSLDAQERLRVGSLARGIVNKPYGVMQMLQAVREALDAE
jgi:two-component system, cell cycle sensor histidine kinase and response regulator CckA